MAQSSTTWPSNILPGNAFEHITLSGVASSDIHLTRTKPRRNKPFIIEEYNRRVPPRRPSEYPPPGSMKLSLRLGKKLGHGAAGRVYEVIVQHDDSSPELRGMAMPNLVVKLSRRDKANAVEREACNYEELEILQGCVVPRCYGLYSTEISPDCGFKPWSRDPIRREPRSRKDDNKPDATQQRRVTSSWTLNMLILERVGECLSYERNRTRELRQSIEDSLFHLAVLGMDHDDVRYPNICRAPSGPGSLPSLPSPWTDITFGWRIIDFHSARKTNYGYSLLTNKYEQEVSILCWNIPHDYVSTDK